MSRLVLLCGAFALSFGSAASARGETWVAVNTSSQSNALPAAAPAEAVPKLAKLKAVTDGKKVYPVDVVNGEVFIACRVEPMAAVRLSLSNATPEGPRLTRGKLGPVLSWPGGPKLVVRDSGVWLDRACVPAQNGPWNIKRVGRGVVELVSDDKKLLCFSSGSVRVQTGKSSLAAAKAIDEDLGVWPPQVRKLREFLVSRALTAGDILSGPLEWAYLGPDAVLVPAAGSKWTAGKRELSPASAEDKLYIVPCDKEEKALLAAASASMPLIGKKTEAGWEFVRDGYTATVLTRGDGDLPDLVDDIWLWTDRRGNGAGAWVFTPADNERVKWPTLESFRLSGLKAGQAVRLASVSGPIEVRLPGKPDAAPAKAVEPAMTLQDWSKRGIFLQGDLLTGGPLFSGSAGRFGALDLDGDGDADVYTSGLGGFTPAEVTVGGFKFDMQDDMPGFYTIAAGPPGELRMATTGGYTGEIGPYTWMFSKSLLRGRLYRGAARGFEEHILYRIRSTDEGPVGGPAAFFFKTTTDNIDRLTMGAFGEGDDAFMDWNIELDPLEDGRHQPPSYRICTYADPYGNRISFTSCVYPQKWDGKKLGFKNQGHRGPDFTPFAAWYRVAKEKLFKLTGLHMAILPEGTFYRCSEGMYGGSLTTGMRIERDSDGATFVVYYSDLMGGLHLKGADYGCQGFAQGHKLIPLNQREALYHREAIDMPKRFIGGRLVGEVEGARLEGPMFLAYFDSDKDGYIDTYLYDADNNGVVDRALFYNAATCTVLMRQGSLAAAWPFRDRRIEVDYLPGNYNKIEELFLKGAAVAPLVIRTTLADSGMPIERSVTSRAFPAVTEKRPPFYVIAGESWQTRIGIDLAHGGPSKSGWRDFSDVGFSGLALHAAAAGLTPVEVTKKLSNRTLAQLDILVMQHPTLPLDDAETLALLRWVRGGGSLLIVPAGDDEPTRIALGGFTKTLGVDLETTRIRARSSIYKYGIQGDWNSQAASLEEIRCPSPAQVISHYQASDPKLLEGFKFLTCVGYPLKLGKGWTTLLRYDGQPVIAEASLGKGKILISGMNIFCNRYVNHIQSVEPQAANTWLLARLVRRCVANHQVLVFESVAASRTGKAFTIRGKGGTVKMPRTFAPAKVLVNGKPATLAKAGLFDVLELPAGKSLVEIKGKK